MFQRAGRGLVVNGIINLQTRRAALEATTRDSEVSFVYVLRYNTEKHFHVKWHYGDYNSVEEVRNRAMKLCADEGGKKCKFNFAPSGGCLAVAEPPANEFLVSRVHADEKEAQEEALAECAADHSKGCKLLHSECAAAPF
jgi:hypothetical protein